MRSATDDVGSTPTNLHSRAGAHLGNIWGICGEYLGNRRGTGPELGTHDFPADALAVAAPVKPDRRSPQALIEVLDGVVQPRVGFGCLVGGQRVGDAALPALFLKGSQHRFGIARMPA